MIHDLNNYNIYECSDGRVRAYNKITQKVISYPRLLVENKLDRLLEDYEDVHHKDENPFNNDIDNLEVKMHGKHQREHKKKYYDKIMICSYCKNEFIWTALSQRYFYSNKSRTQKEKCKTGPYCSKTCAGKGSSKAK